jgi:hypothetical protein
MQRIGRRFSLRNFIEARVSWQLAAVVNANRILRHPTQAERNSGDAVNLSARANGFYNPASFLGRFARRKNARRPKDRDPRSPSIRLGFLAAAEALILHLTNSPRSVE